MKFSIENRFTVYYMKNGLYLIKEAAELTVGENATSDLCSDNYVVQ